MKNETTDEINRRKFLLKISIALGGIAAAAVTIPVIGSLLTPFLQKEKQTWRKVGIPDDFKIGATTLVNFINADPLPYSGITAQSGAWLRRNSENDFIAFAVNCSHLGCPVRWEKDAELFMCPCHGGVYYKDGSVASGPPPKALSRYTVRVYNGEVQLLTTAIPITTA